MTLKKWSTHNEIRAKLQAIWESGQLLAELVQPTGLFPWRMPLKHPSSNELTTQFSEASAWVYELRAFPESNGVTLEWRDINHRQLGRNQLPVALHMQSALDVIAWIKKTQTAQVFQKLSHQLLSSFPKLRAWVLKKPHQLIEHGAQLPKLMAILHWISENPKSQIYLRQLSLPGIDTKFIEQHKKLLTEWFDLHLPEESIVRHTNFALRYGFLDKPELIRFRILDESLYIQGLSDITITTQAFSRLNLPVEVVFVTENDINALTFPAHPKAIVLFGRGYGFTFLSECTWLNTKRIRYWGDIDTHGFAILNQFRHYFSQTESFLMDEQTLLNHKAHWTTESKPSRGILSYLTQNEGELYHALQENRFGMQVRLEQEYVRYDLLLECL